MTDAQGRSVTMQSISSSLKVRKAFIFKVFWKMERVENETDL